MSEKRNMIRLEEHETAQLMRAATGRGLVLAFGPGWAALDTDASPWAVPLLEAMRAVVLVDGAGI